MTTPTMNRAAAAELTGRRVPYVIFPMLDADGRLGELSSAEIVGGRRVVLFALPGAFIPTCSMTAHLRSRGRVAPAATA
jgi:peroxiredoxin